MMEIEAIRERTGEVEAVVRIDDGGAAVTVFKDGTEEPGLRGPFANIAFHIVHRALIDKYPDPEKRPNLRASQVRPMQIIERLPPSYGGFKFVKKA
jgi:hypothetical protein